VESPQFAGRHGSMDQGATKGQPTNHPALFPLQFSGNMQFTLIC